MTRSILEVENLTISFDSDDGRFKAVDDVSFSVSEGETVGLVGESGCGKSVTALGILRLIPTPVGSIDRGRVLLNGENLLEMPVAELRKVRGAVVSMVFQEPGAALSPLHRVGHQLVETLLLHRDMTRKAAWETAASWLEKVGISDPGERMYAYPFQLSGGMQQRVMIAMALMLEPRLVIADEPTTALDVTVQAQIFDLIRDMKQRQTAVLLITHDMGVVWEMCDRVVVMYASRVAEEGSLADIFDHSRHPYTRGLLASIPRLSAPPGRLEAIRGQVPSPLHYPSGCHFRDRCPHAFDRCALERPPLYRLGDGHRSACFVAKELS